jgi:hypothetical protein
MSLVLLAGASFRPNPPPTNFPCPFLKASEVFTAPEYFATERKPGLGD